MDFKNSIDSKTTHKNKTKPMKQLNVSGHSKNSVNPTRKKNAGNKKHTDVNCFVWKYKNSEKHMRQLKKKEQKNCKLFTNPKKKNT